MTKAELLLTKIAAEAEKFCCPGFATPAWRHAYAKGAFAKGQRVAVRAMGADFKWNWDECATIVDGCPMSVSPTSGDWYLVRFDKVNGSGSLYIGQEGLSAIDQRAAA